MLQSADNLPLKRPSERVSITLHKDRLKLGDVNGLITALYTSTTIPSWISIENASSIIQTVLILLPGLDRESLQESESFAPFLSGLCKNKSFTSHFEKASCRGYQHDLVILQSPQPKPEPPVNSLGINQFLLSETQLMQNNYPLSAAPGFVESNTNGEHKGILGMDCEMVLTSQGSEVARVSLVNAKGKVLYDQYILPNNPVINYLTQYSGITPDILGSATLTLAQAQSDLIGKIHSDAVLCGHSLDNDLNCLKLIHRKIADSSILYPNPIASHKNGLKKLALKYLKKQIQSVLGM